MTGADGKTYQKKVGPRGGKYYRSKGDKGWSEWQNGEVKESLSYHISSIFEHSKKIQKINSYLFND